MGWEGGRNLLDKRFHNFSCELTAGVKREILLPLLSDVSFEGLCVADCIKFVAKGVCSYPQV